MQNIRGGGGKLIWPHMIKKWTLNGLFNFILVCNAGCWKYPEIIDAGEINQETRMLVVFHGIFVCRFGTFLDGFRIAFVEGFEMLIMVDNGDVNNINEELVNEIPWNALLPVIG